MTATPAVPTVWDYCSICSRYVPTPNLLGHLTAEHPTEFRNAVLDAVNSPSWSGNGVREWARTLAERVEHGQVVVTVDVYQREDERMQRAWVFHEVPITDLGLEATTA